MNMAKITIKHIISLFIILLSLTFVQAEKSKFISISSVNEGKPAAPGKYMISAYLFIIYY